jgi:site-specific recombinase XerD
MKHSIFISFQIKKSKTNAKGYAPIYMRITIDCKRTEISTHRFIPPNEWDDAKEYVSGKSHRAIIINNYLDSLKNKVLQHFNILDSMDKEINIKIIKDKLKGNSEKKYSIIKIFQYHNSELQQRVGIDITMSTYKRYLVSINRLKAFIQFQFNSCDLNLNDLNHAFITKYELYLKTEHNCGQNTTTKYLKQLKKIINMALANEWISRDPFIRYKCTYKPVNRGYLNSQELEILQNKSFDINRLQRVLDVFLFCCYTGLSWSDVDSLPNDAISQGIDGEKWIIVYRKKTNVRSPIPLLPEALKIIEKYKDDPEVIAGGKLLPVNSNQRMNGYLKEIQEICGINKRLSMHLSRHTFATTVTLANGVPIETVSKMLGHSSIKTTQIYSKVVDSKISDDMNTLKSKMNKLLINNAI